MQFINEQLLYGLHSLTGVSPAFDSLWYLCATWLGWMFVLIVFVLWVCTSYIHEHPLESLMLKLKDFTVVTTVSGISFAIAVVLKEMIHKARPFITHENIHPFFNPGLYDSMPSGHAVFFLMFALMIYRHHKITGLIGIVIAFIVGMSRIIVGVHYPVDIVAGWGIAIVLYFSAEYVFNRIKNRNQKTT
jgi:undecaprenyl-diphosphatase